MVENTIPDHKLCGFLCTVLKIPPPHSADLTKTLTPHTPCHLFAGDSEIGFVSQNGIVFSVINPNAGALVAAECTSTPSSSSSVMKKWRRIGLLHGSRSVVHQLRALVNHKCLEIRARVMYFEVDEHNCGEIRVVVLVDVYLPIELWSGWQFPRMGSTAAALFRHLSCHWQARNSMLELGKTDREHNDSIWNLSDCHVLGCKQHCNTLDTFKKKLFELHDIFMSLPSVSSKGDHVSSSVNPVDSSRSGLWVVSDDVLINILTTLGPLDLIRVSSTCHHLRFLAASIMPCMKLKLFPHQHAAVEWMLQRERDSEVLPHPLYIDFLTEDGFPFYVNTVSGEIVTNTKPTFRDFHGGMFCDEPGLGKTITALSLILKTQGTLAVLPDGAQVIWCSHNGDRRCGYYELSADNVTCGKGLSSKRVVSQTAHRGQFSLDKFSSRGNLNGFSKRVKFVDSALDIAGLTELHPREEVESPKAAYSTPATFVVRCTRSRSGVKKNFLHKFATSSSFSTDMKTRESSRKRRHSSNHPINSSLENDRFSGVSYKRKRCKKLTAKHSEYNETWVQCDACKKWRKLAEASVADATTAWFCSMNSDCLHQSCNVPEESWDYCQSITNLPGFHSRETSGGKAENVSFFISVLKEHYSLINSETKKALTWLAKLSHNKLSEMETTGLLHPVMQTRVACGGVAHEFHRVFQAFGLIKREEQGTTKWYYPKTLANLVFDVDALRIALCEPLDSLRLYLSKATLVVVPSNLVDHWNTQIQKHVRPGQLRIYIWTDHKKPCAHNLAWDYDVVITTFSRLSTEWSPRKRSVLMQVHWFRIIFDEGHTLCSSLNLTNKLQMSFSLTARNRWLLTGTPTPNTPNSQLSHLQPMLKFLREEVYGQNQKSWENGILRPFEAEMEEGRSRLLELLHRCMISARKVDLQSIPPCIKKVTFLNFTEEHARSYNELVVTVRRNILMADWNDPSHVESLLNPKQWKFRSNTIRNVRLSCCVAGHIRVTDAGQDIQETMDILVENGLDPISEEYAFIRYNLLYGGKCMRCQEWCRLPVITPCRHLLCLDCVALNSESCTFPGCGHLYEMQSPEILTRPENPNPKWPVPKDLIELQPSYKQDDWHSDWQSTSSSKVTYLVHRLKELLEANRKIGYSIDEGVDGKGLYETNASAKCSNESYELPPEKVIIFSQFLEHIHVIEQQLMVADIKFTGMYSPMHSSNKMKSLTTFQHDANCIALLMDGSAALGLDLSFVTHVFLMEPIWDKRYQKQRCFYGCSLVQNRTGTEKTEWKPNPKYS